MIDRIIKILHNFFCKINLHKFEEHYMSYDDDSGYHEKVCTICKIERKRTVAGIWYNTPFLSRYEKNPGRYTIKQHEFIYRRNHLSYDMINYLEMTEKPSYVPKLCISKCIPFIPVKFFIK